jgi:lipid A 3-O-deacylase
MAKIYKQIFFFGLLAFITPQNTFGQMIDNTALYRNIAGEKSIRVHYENDYFSRTDIYYTQGINVELVHPALNKFVPTRLLLGLHSGNPKYGVALEHLGYTPTRISSPKILPGDRPFAGCIMIKLFSAANDSVNKVRVTSSLSAGVIGPAAGAREFQSSIHRWLDTTLPRGWKNQISNDVILNYHANIYKSILDYKALSVSVRGSAQIGTLHTRTGTGLIMVAGKYDNPWKFFQHSSRNFQIYLYEEPFIHLVGYDATLQGGVFNRNNPYTIPGADLTRLVFQNNSGLVIKIKNVYLEYFQSYLTKEFRTGKEHFWGGVRIGLSY